MWTRRFLIVSLFLSLFIAVVYADEFYAKFGTSDKEINVNVEVGKTGKFEVARISNEGTLNLTVTASWQPNYDSTAGGIELVFYPNNIWLMPGQAMQIYCEVTEATELGTYSGIIDFKTNPELPAGYTGNPSSPGGSAHATFNIIEAPPPPPEPFVLFGPPYILGIPLLLLAAIGGTGGGLSGLFLYRHRRNHKPPQIKIPKLKTTKKVVSTKQRVKTAKKETPQDILALLTDAEEKKSVEPKTQEPIKPQEQEEDTGPTLADLPA